MIKPERAPYSSTKRDPRQTQIDIERLLEKYGITDLQWTRKADEITLRFVTDVMIQKRSIRMGFQFNPPTFAKERRTWNKEKGQYDVLPLPNIAQSMVLLHEYLKNKLAAVAWGLRPMEEEFLAEVVVPDPVTHAPRRFGDIVREQNFLALPPAPAEEEPKKDPEQPKEVTGEWIRPGK